MPGTIVARAFANDWIGDLKWQVQNDELTEPVVPEMNALYAVDPWFPSYRVNTNVGVTAMQVTPGVLNLVGGNGVVIKTPGLDFETMVRREPSSVVMSLASAARRQWSDDARNPMTLQEASSTIRATLDDATPEDAALLGHLLVTAARVARELGVSDGGSRVVVNNGGGAGQTVFHLHVHVLAGRPMTWPPG